MSREAPSPFIPVVAWMFIIFASIGLVMSIAQNVAVQTMFPFPYMEEIAQGENEGVIAFLSNIQWILWLFAFITLIELISAIGLLLRKEWARKIFIAVLSVAIIYQMGLLVVQWRAMSVLLESWETVSDSLSGLFTLIKIACAVLSIGISALFVWLVKQFGSLEVKREFVRKR